MNGLHPCAWRDRRVITVLLLVFLCGAAAGVLGGRLGAPARADQRSWREGGKEISVQRFKRELNLTPQQAKEIESVLDDFVMYYHNLQSQMDEVRVNGKTRILQVLQPEQRQKFEKMLQDLKLR